MVESRLFFWESLSLIIIIFYPIIRKLISWEDTSIEKKIRKSLLIVLTISILLHLAYFKDLIANTEFLFFQILLLILYFATGFNYVITKKHSEKINVKSFKIDLLKTISKGYSGTEPQYDNLTHYMIISSPYKLSYQLAAIDGPKDDYSLFELIPYHKNFRNYKIIFFIGYLTIFQSLLENKEFVNFPLLKAEVSGVMVIILSLTLVFVMTWIEILEANSIVSELPKLYSKLLKNKALGRVKGGDRSELQSIKEQAQFFVDKKDRTINKIKEIEIREKIDNVFGINSKQKLDPDTLSRVRLMESVKRILNSTPPWKSVSLTQIVSLSEGTEEQVELIISGLIELKEVKGIYDIWSKMYVGTSLSHWYITKLMNDIAGNGSKLENIRIYPDGGLEFYLEKPKQKP